MSEENLAEQLVNATEPNNINATPLIVRDLIVSLSVLTVILISTLNPLCLVTIYRVANIQPTTKIFMASLIVSDLAGGLLCCIPINILQFLGDTHVLSSAYVVQDFFVGLSFQSLMLLTIDRYLAIFRCLDYPRLVTVRKAKLVILSMWVLVILTVTLIHACRIFYCTFYQIQIVFCTILIFMLFQLCVMVTMYLHLLVIAQRHARQIRTQETIYGRQNPGLTRHKISSFKTIMIIFILFLIGWVPGVGLLMYTYATDTQHFMLLHFTTFLYYTTNWAEVIIYCIRNTEIKKMLYKVVTTFFNNLQCSKCLKR